MLYVAATKRNKTEPAPDTFSLLTKPTTFMQLGFRQFLEVFSARSHELLPERDGCLSRVHTNFPLGLLSNSRRDRYFYPH